MLYFCEPISNKVPIRLFTSVSRSRQWGLMQTPALTQLGSGDNHSPKDSLFFDL